MEKRLFDSQIFRVINIFPGKEKENEAEILLLINANPGYFAKYLILIIEGNQNINLPCDTMI